MRRLALLAFSLLVAASFAAFAGQTPVGAAPTAIQVVAVSGNNFQISAAFNTDEIPVSFSVTNVSGATVSGVSLVSCSHAVFGNCTAAVPNTDGSGVAYNSGAAIANLDGTNVSDGVNFVVSVTLSCNTATAGSAVVVAQQGGLTMSAPITCGAAYVGSPYGNNCANGNFVYGYFTNAYCNFGYCGNSLYTSSYDANNYYNNGYLGNPYYAGNLYGNQFYGSQFYGNVGTDNTSCLDGTVVHSYTVANGMTPNNFLYTGNSCLYYGVANNACAGNFIYQDPSASAAITAPVAVIPGTNILANETRRIGAVPQINGTDATKRNFAFAAQQAAAAQAVAAQQAAAAAAAIAAQTPRVVAPNTGEVGLADPQYPFVTFYSEIPADQAANVVTVDDSLSANTGE